MKILIINIGPPGDVIRTTVLLRELKGEIFWLTKIKCKDVLNYSKISKLFLLENKEDLKTLNKTKFDLVISLNEEKEALDVVKKLDTKKLIGIYLNQENKVEYTPESAYWFNMSLSSKFGKKKADKLKWKNKKSVPQILVEMIGEKWTGQEYDLEIKQDKNLEFKGRVGLINVTTGLWPNKNWSGYNELAKLLKKKGYSPVFLGMRPSIKDHIKDIQKCELIVCGDTLGLHLALALKKKVVALFNCTSPSEIFDYGRTVKIVSPFLKTYFYQKEYNSKATSAISTDKVYLTVKKLLKG